MLAAIYVCFYVFFNYTELTGKSYITKDFSFVDFNYVKCLKKNNIDIEGEKAPLTPKLYIRQCLERQIGIDCISPKKIQDAKNLYPAAVQECEKDMQNEIKDIEKNFYDRKTKNALEIFGKLFLNLFIIPIGIVLLFCLIMNPIVLWLINGIKIDKKDL